MTTIQITLKGIAAELVLGNYMPKDSLIFNNWEDFYHYNDLIHESQLLAEHISEIEIKQDDVTVYSGKIPASQFRVQKSSIPVLEQRALYLRTECAEEAVFQATFETESFDKSKLVFETQDYDLLFKVGNSFLAKLLYNDKELELNWVSGTSIGNICLLCRYEDGYLVPVYDAVNKKENNS